MSNQTKREMSITPPQLILIVFGVLILLGTCLLALPIANSNGKSIGLLNAFFMATSAVCVNGLSVLDAGTSLSLFGQVVIMFLIQIGGVGFMTFSVLVAIVLGKRIGLKQRMFIQQTTQAPTSQGLIKLSLSIFYIALIFELVATFILTLRWMNEFGVKKALYYALFHSISAFNNAGFSLWSDSLAAFVHDPIINFVIITLFVSGGLGFIVITDILQRHSWRKFTLHTKMTLVSTAFLLVCGFLLLFLLESFNAKTFGSLSWSERILAALFQSATPRSAGFQTIEIGNMLSASQIILILLMFIGASSGGTGGGIKTNTFVVLMLATMNTFRGGGPIHVFHRRISPDTVMRALAVVMSSLACIFIVALLLSITEGLLEEQFLEVLFEATSAFSTTGLSMGLTSELSPVGKVIIAYTMFIGRLGPLTLAYALAKKKRTTKITYPEDRILIG